MTIYRYTKILTFVAFITIFYLPATTTGQTTGLKIAVAANFTETAQKIAALFQQREGIAVEIISGSSGKLTTQILLGAPFDLFLSADQEHPKKLIAAGFAAPETLKEYATGVIVFGHTWPSSATDQLRPWQQLLPRCKKIAIANPDHAPYGQAAVETLKTSALWAKIQDKIVMGESVGQTMSFLESGSADCGFVSHSQIQNNPTWRHRYHQINPGLASPLIQAAVVLKRSTHADQAAKFLAFLSQPESQEIIKRMGYTIP